MICSRCPGSSTQATLVRIQSGNASVSMRVPGGPSTRWSMAPATIRPLSFVRWISSPPASRARCSAATSGASSTAATLGSFFLGGRASLATSSDWTISRAGPSTGSTSKQIAATARWV